MILTTAFNWLVGIAQAADPASLNGAKLPTSPIPSAAADAAKVAPDIANHILDTLTFFAYPLAFAGIIYMAFLLLAGGSSAENWTKVRKGAMYIIVGFFLIYGANIFVSVLHSVLLSK